MAWSVPRTWVNGEIVTQTEMNTHVRDQFREVWRRVGYTEFTGDVSTTTATEAAPLDVVSAGAITLEAVPHKIEFSAPGYSAGGGSGCLNLWDTTDLGRLHFIAASIVAYPYNQFWYLTPTAASHTFKVRLWQTGGSTAIVRAGAGGPGVIKPGFIAIWAKGGA